jgi:hypothetical protein
MIVFVSCGALPRAESAAMDPDAMSPLIRSERTAKPAKDALFFALVLALSAAEPRSAPGLADRSRTVGGLKASSAVWLRTGKCLRSNNVLITG